MSPAYLLLVALALLSSANLCLASMVVPFSELAPVFRQGGPCDSDPDCSGGKQCLNLDKRCSGSDCEGVCSDLISCSCEEPCGANDVCVETADTPGGLQWCIVDLLVDALSSFVKPIECSNGSNGAEESDGSGASSNGQEETKPNGGGSNESNPGANTQDGICIGVDLLSNFAPDELVFKKHALARVLCDSAGSCATKGHIVNYKGSGMMMVTYCSIVGCNEKVMKVNSPRYQIGLKVKSRTEGMHFTALAARYHTIAEEAVLGAAIRLGF